MTTLYSLYHSVPLHSFAVKLNDHYGSLQFMGKKSK